MFGDLTKSETTALFKEFHYIMGGVYTKGQWERFMEVKTAERWRADMEALEAEGLVDVFRENGEWRYEATELGRASARASQLERMGG